ncbi:JAB domain-containing protein [Patescibacteria group bacterium]
MGKYLKELKIRYVKTKKRNLFYGDTIHSPDEIYKIFKSMRLNDKEQIISIHLNNRLEINCFEVVSIGDSGSCLFSPKEILKGVLLSNSSTFIYTNLQSSNW